jgi:hypothetical protein
MKTAELEDLKRDMGQLDVFVNGHESIHLMSGGHAVAVLTPIPKPMPPTKIQWPDFEAQQRAIFGDRVLPAGTIQELMDEERGER